MAIIQCKELSDHLGTNKEKINTLLHTDAYIMYNNIDIHNIFLQLLCLPLTYYHPDVYCLVCMLSQLLVFFIYYNLILNILHAVNLTCTDLVGLISMSNRFSFKVWDVYRGSILRNHTVSTQYNDNFLSYAWTYCTA